MTGSDPVTGPRARPAEWVLTLVLEQEVPPALVSDLDLEGVALGEVGVLPPGGAAAHHRLPLRLELVDHGVLPTHRRLDVERVPIIAQSVDVVRALHGEVQQRHVDALSRIHVDDPGRVARAAAARLHGDRAGQPAVIGRQVASGFQATVASRSNCNDRHEGHDTASRRREARSGGA